MHRFLRFRYSSKLCKKDGNFDTSKLVANFKTTFGCITINIDDKSEIPEQEICIVYSFFFGGGEGQSGGRPCIGRRFDSNYLPIIGTFDQVLF